MPYNVNGKKYFWKSVRVETLTSRQSMTRTFEKPRTQNI